jgi:hypothetical protein
LGQHGKPGYARLRGGAENQKKEKVLLQEKGKLHGGALGVLPRHRNTDCKRCVKERKSETIGLTIYGR